MTFIQERSLGGRGKALLTPEQVAAIAAEYDGRTETIDRLVAKFGVRRHNIRAAALRSGYQRRLPRIEWTPDKVDYLRQNYGRTPLEAICAHLKCTTAAISNQKKRMGLSTWAISGEIGYNVRQLEQMTKVDHRVWLEYIEAGELKAVELSTYVAGNVTRVVSIEKLHDFLRSRPEFLNPGKMGLSARAALELFNLPPAPRFKRVICRSQVNDGGMIMACTSGPYHHGDLKHREVQVRKSRIRCSEEPFSFWSPIFEPSPICPRCGSYVTRFSEDRVYLDEDPGDDEVMKMIAGKINLAYADGKITDHAGNEVSEQELLAYAFHKQRNPKVAFRVFARLIEKGLTPAVKRPADCAAWRTFSLMDCTLTGRQDNELERLRQQSNICITWPPGEGKMFFLAYLFGMVPGRHAVFVNTRTLAEQWARFLEAHTTCNIRVRRSDKPARITVRLYDEGGNEHAQVEIWGYQTHHRFPDEQYVIVGYDEAHYLPGTSAHRVALLPSQLRVGLTATPYREDGRASLIALLTGDAGKESWADVLADRGRPQAVIDVVITDDVLGKHAAAAALIPASGRGLIFVEAIDDGHELARRTGLPFVFSQTRDRMDQFIQNRVTICSRVGDHGLDLQDLEWVIEFGFQKGSRAQQLQRHGRLLHSAIAARHHILMTRKELTLYSKRLTALEDQGLQFRLQVWEERAAA